MTKGIFWTIETKDGELADDMMYFYKTRQELSEAGRLGEGVKAVKVKMVKVFFPLKGVYK